MSHRHVVIVGSGILGLAHAITALEAGWTVTMLERDGRPLGASIRNFGTLWPIGCAPGPERDQALEGVRRWRFLAREAGFSLEPVGSLSLAYRDESWAVLREFVAANALGGDFQLLDPGAVERRFPAANLNGLRGALFSGAEAVVHSPSALPALVELARQRGATIHFGTAVVRCHDDAVETADGRCFAFDRLVIAAGDELRLLFPRELAAASVVRCRLQMMRTAPQPAGFRLGAVLVSDLTLCHYPAFRNCPSTRQLAARLDAELPRHRQSGVHVIVAQHPDGSLVIGDSHEYADDFNPEHRTDVDELILEAMRVFVRPPRLEISARWQGFYPKSTVGQTQVVLQPRERVSMIAAIGGLGMTLSWGLARREVERWSALVPSLISSMS